MEAGRHHTTRWVDTSAGRVRVLTGGDGPPAVLLGALGKFAESWEPVWFSLAHHLTLYAVDLPGFGLSAKPRTAYTPEFHLNALEEIITGT